MKTKYPDFSLAEMRALIVSNGTSPIPDDYREVDTALDNGRFVLCWDDKSPIEAVPSVGALVSVIRSRGGQTEYRVRLDSGYIANYKNAKLIDTEKLPMVVSGGKGLCGAEMTGNYVGFFKAPGGREFCVVASSRFGNEELYLFEPKDLAFLSDIKFGITGGENG